MNLPVEYAINHFFPATAFDLIYLEAVANALDASATEISIDIDLEAYSKPQTLKLVIRDNGVGFTDDNFDRFSNLMKVKDAQHKGLGRLVYLQYFSNVTVDSFFGDGMHRTFLFEDAIKNVKEVCGDKDAPTSTELRFGNFKGVQIKSYDYVSPIAVKRKLKELFMPRLFALKQHGTNFKISISLRTQEEKREKGFVSGTEVLSPVDIEEFNAIEFDAPLLDLMNSKCKMLYHLKTGVSSAEHCLVTDLCVDGRTFPLKLATDDQMPLGTSATFILESCFLDSKTNESRQELSLKHEDLDNVKRVFADKITEILNDNIPQIKERNREITASLDEMYPHLAGYFSHKTIGVINRNRAIIEAQTAFCKDEKEILEAKDLSDAQYLKSLAQASRVLSQYVLYRNKIIRKMEAITSQNKEADIHNLIIPMKCTMDAKDFSHSLYNNNTWLLDDKYMTYQSILSDRQMQELMEKIMREEESGDVNLRPDIAIVFSENIETACHPVDVVIVELKRKGLDHLGKHAIIEQIKQRARRLVSVYGTKIQRMWFFGVIDFDKDMRISLKEDEWQPIYSKGESYYKELFVVRVDADGNELSGQKVPVSVTLLSQESLWKDALARNETFLSILKDSIRQHVDA